MIPKYTTRLFLPNVEKRMPLESSKLEVLVLRPFQHLDWDPDSVFRPSMDPIPAVPYEELKTMKGRNLLWDSLASLFPSIKAVIFDLHYGRVIRLAGDMASRGAVEIVEKELDEELWMTA